MLCILYTKYSLKRVGAKKALAAIWIPMLKSVAIRYNCSK